jgi:hypothetical protein
MKTFLSEFPQMVPLDELTELDPSIETASRDVAGAMGMPAANSASSILETYAAVLTSRMLHDAEDKDAFNKGVIKGLLIGAALPKICHNFVNVNKQKEGKSP